MSSLGSGLLGLDSEKLMLGIKPTRSLISILCNACRSVSASRAKEFVHPLSRASVVCGPTDASGLQNRKGRLPGSCLFLVNRMYPDCFFLQETANLKPSFPMVIVN